LSSVGLKPDEVQSLPIASRSSSSWKVTALLSLLLAAVTAVLYMRVAQYDFVNYDDTIYVTQNAQVQAGLTPETLRWAFTTYAVGTWHPLTWISHALDCDLFGLDPAGPHSINVLLHVVNVMLLFWILRRATGFTGRSFAVAALFAVHPINVESVVWIAERKNSLSLLFFLLALAAYQWYAESAQPIPTHPKRWDEWGTRVGYLLVVALFALGLTAKPQVITFPFVLLLWDFWPLRRIAFRSALFAFRQNLSTNISGEQRIRDWRFLLREKLPLFALAGVSAAITLAAQRADGNKAWYPLPLRIEYAIVSYVQYIAKALWPTRLSPFYPHPDSVNAWQVGGAALLLAAITIAVVRVRRSQPYLLVGWFWFLGTLVPMLGLEGVGYQGKQGIADRYAYLPFIGLFIMACWGVAEWAERTRVSKRLVRSITAATLLALTIVSYRQIGYWRDNVTLWSHALEVTQGNFLAENNLGRALLQQGRTKEGVAHFYKAAQIYPDDPVSNFNIGLYEQKQGNYTAAVARFQKTLSVTRDPELRAAALKNLGVALTQLGDAADAQRLNAAP